MKCRACWAEKAFQRPVPGWPGVLLTCLLRVPLKCHHCYHKFSVSWFSTIGKQLAVPPHLLHQNRAAAAPGQSTPAQSTAGAGTPPGHASSRPGQSRAT
jgi:hypothetical protein